MMFEHTHSLAVDGFAGRNVWRSLIGDALAANRRTSGYSYVFVHRNLPQSLNLWHDGQVILSSPGNTGVPTAPTQLGTFPVFEHIPIGTMSGTNPDGSHYHDPGIRYISYFHGGDAIHAFNRSRHPPKPRLRRTATPRRSQGLALHPDRHPRHDRELTRTASRAASTARLASSPSCRGTSISIGSLFQDGASPASASTTARLQSGRWSRL
jgi:hypothetical protein